MEKQAQIIGQRARKRGKTFLFADFSLNRAHVRGLYLVPNREQKEALGAQRGAQNALWRPVALCHCSIQEQAGGRRAAAWSTSLLAFCCSCCGV